MKIKEWDIEFLKVQIAEVEYLLKLVKEHPLMKISLSDRLEELKEELKKNKNK